MLQKNKLTFLVVGIFLLVVGQTLLAKTMFMDGLFYTTIARNIAIGKGDIWHLFFTKTIYPEFHEHPPLSMWLESWYFKLFGYHWIVDKFYTLSTYLFTGVALRWCWQQLSFPREQFWSVLLCWLVIPAVFWAVGNNLLENTMMIFTTLSIGLVLKSIRTNQLFFIFLAGTCLTLAFLTKGFVALFPLAFFFFYFLVFRSISFLDFIKKTGLYLLGFLIPLGLLFLLNTAAYQSFIDYLNIQVIKSVQQIATVETRFFIVKRLLFELLIPGLICFIIYLVFFKQKNQILFDSSDKKWSFVFLLLGLSGVLPIMISMKQSGFYILATYPFFALSFALFFRPYFNLITQKSKDSKGLFIFSLCFFMLGLIWSFSSVNRYGKDAAKVKDMALILTELKKEEIIAVPAAMHEDWALAAYYYRFGFVSLKATNEPTEHHLLVNPDEKGNFSIPTNYRLVPLKTDLFQLYEQIK